MKLSRNVVLSCEIMAAHKLRTMLSVLGIVVGVGAVVLMVSAGKGAEKRILDRIRDMGTNLIIVNAGQTRIIAGRQRQMATVTTLRPDDAKAIVRDCHSVKLAAAAFSKKLAAQFEAENTNTTIVGMTDDGFRIRNITIDSGRVFHVQENRGRRRVAVLGPTVVRNLFGDTDPIGLLFRISRVPFEVIGVTKPKGIDVNGADQDDLLSQVDGIGVATGETGGSLKGPAGGKGSGEAADISQLRVKGGDKSVKTAGPGAEKKIKGNVKKKAPMASGGTGMMSASDVAKVVNRRLGAIKGCYEQALKRDPTLQGKVTVRFTISGSGKVTTARTTLNELTPAVGNCMVSAFKRFRFPPPEGGTVTFEYPFMFTPAG